MYMYKVMYIYIYIYICMCLCVHLLHLLEPTTVSRITLIILYGEPVRDSDIFTFYFNKSTVYILRILYTIY